MTYHPKTKSNMQDLEEFIYYALKSDIFDPLTEYNLPQSRLRGLCVITSQQEFISSQQVKQYMYSMRIFHENYWSSPYFMQRCQQCLEQHWMNKSSPLSLIHDHGHYNFSQFAIGIDKLSKYVFTNCQINSRQTEFLSKRKRLKESDSNSITSIGNSNRILIVGGSSAGLISALAMFRSGLLGKARFYIDQVSIIDKRDSYSRKQWFDLIGKPFYHSLNVLFDEFAFDTQYVSYVKEVNDNLTTVLLPSSVLERFLAKTVTMTGINIEYNHQYLGYCQQFENVAVILNNTLIDKNNPLIDYNIKPKIWNCGNDILNLNINDRDIQKLKTNNGIYNINKNMFRFEQFSVIIGSDGTKSGVRDMYKMGWYQQNIINIARFVSDSKDRMDKNIPLIIDNLQQLSLLVNFKTIRHSDPNLFDENNPYESHNCPALKFGNDDRILDPWSASFHVDGVHTVFKRFYYNDCQMQILLNQQSGKQLMDFRKENTDLLWSIVFNTTKHYLQNPPSTMQELQNKYLVSSFGTEGDGNFATGNKQILFLNHSIFLPERSIKVVKTTNDSFGIVLLIGDSSMKSHYRLGVGINRIMDSYYDYVEFYRDIKQKMFGDKELIDFIVDFAKDIESKLQYFVEFQASTIVMESYCDFIIFFNEIDNLNEAQILTKRDREYHDYVRLSSLKEQINLIKTCIAKYKDIKMHDI